MANKVLILRWSGSAYDSLAGLLELAGLEFAALGIEVRFLTIDGPDWVTQLGEILKQGDISFALTMSGIGTDALVDGKLVWEIARVPLFNWSCDHPCHYPTRHALRSKFVLHGYVFPDHARYARDHLGANAMAFAVHLGIPPRSLFGATLPPDGRNGRILFSKSGADIGKIEASWRGYGADLHYVLSAAAEELFCQPVAAFLPALQRIGESRGLFLDGNNLLTLSLIQELDVYVRARRADVVMNAILRYPVDVFGTGWDHIDWDAAAARPNGARFHGPLAWRAMVGQLPNYLGAVSTNPLVEESVHDRVFFALAAGVVPIGDANGFTRSYMQALDPYCFSFTRERIEQAVEAVLADPAEAIARCEETWQALATPFGMRRSVRQIVQFAALHPLNAPCVV
jgi:hypothetical protein